MPEIIFALIVAVIFGFFSINFFPPIHQMLSSVDTTGMTYLGVASVKVMPYVLLFGIIYGLVLIVSKRVNK
jgi:hypothetical protein